MVYYFDDFCLIIFSIYRKIYTFYYFIYFKARNYNYEVYLICFKFIRNDIFIPILLKMLQLLYKMKIKLEESFFAAIISCAHWNCKYAYVNKFK